MVGRILYLVFGTLLIVLTVGDAWFTENDAHDQQANLVGVLGGIGLMVAAVAFRLATPRPPQPPTYPLRPAIQQAPPQPNPPGHYGQGPHR